MWQIWLIIAGLFFIGEMITVGFLIFWFGIGALVAMFISLFTKNIIVQTVVFLVSSTILIFSTKPLVKKFLDVQPTKTNAFSIIGKTALVIKEISPNSFGQIKVNGEVWTAKTDNDETIPEGSKVEVLEIRGVKVLVKPI